MMEANSNFTSVPYLTHMALSVSRPVQEPTGECYTGAYSCCLNEHVMHIWNRYSAICSTYHTLLKASPGVAIFGWDMLFNIPCIADWKKIGEHRQLLTDHITSHENEGRINYDYKVGQESTDMERKYSLQNRVITSVHTRKQIRTDKHRRVKPFHE